MAFSILVFRAQLDGLLAAFDTELAEIRRDRFIKDALEGYSRDKPDEITSDITGDAGKYYAINTTNLPSWVEGWSQVIKIEYPAATVASDEAPTYLDPEDWDDDYWDASGVSPVRYLYLPNHAPAATEKLRVRYTAPYLWVASSITEAVARTAHGFLVNDYLYKDQYGTWFEATDSRIATHRVTAVADVDNYTRAVLEANPPAQDFFAICTLAASLCCRAIATKYSRTTDTTISADSVDHLSRAQQFALRADEYMKQYRESLGISGEDGVRVAPAGEFVDWDTAPSWPMNRRYLFHGPETR